MADNVLAFPTPRPARCPGANAEGRVRRCSGGPERNTRLLAGVGTHTLDRIVPRNGFDPTGARVDSGSVQKNTSTLGAPVGPVSDRAANNP